MTGEQRRHIRQMIDQRRRELEGLTASQEGRCKGCGTEYCNRTAGCGNCDDRARRRKRRDARPVEVLPSHCVGCGTPWMKYTYGCPACHDRRRNRDPERRRRVAVHKAAYRERKRAAA